MTHPTIRQALGQARLAELHHRAQRDALARAARQARRARGQQPGGHGPEPLAAVTPLGSPPRNRAGESVMVPARHRDAGPGTGTLEHSHRRRHEPDV
jgi:hypothetical protein